MPLLIQSTSEGAVISVRVVPNSGQSGVVGRLGEALKIKVAAPPERGKANQAVQSVLAQLFKIAPARVLVLAGHVQPRKRILLRGISVESVQKLLGD